MENNQSKLDTEAAQRIIDRDHLSGVRIAQKLLNPVLNELTTKHHYNRLELASALLVMAYAVLRKGRDPHKARALLAVLSKKALKFIDRQESKKLH